MFITIIFSTQHEKRQLHSEIWKDVVVLVHKYSHHNIRRRNRVAARGNDLGVKEG
jgi:hypothetical protein